MNYFQIFREIYRHRRLSEKRSAAWEQNKAARYVIWVVSAVIILYLLFLALMFALIVNEDRHLTGIRMTFLLLPFCLALDFLVRFTQQTPSQLIKPYLLLPIPRLMCIDCFLVSMLMNPANLIWMALFLPLNLMTILPVNGLWVALGMAVVVWIYVLLNSQWYLLVRSLITKNYLWWILPAVVYAAISIPMWLGPKAGIRQFYKFYTEALPSVWGIVGVFLLLALLYAVNRQLQWRLTWNETAEDEDNSRVTQRLQLGVLDRYGQTGQFLRLEVQSILRCKNIRKTVISACIIVGLLALCVSFTDIYDSPIMKSYWCVYNYALIGAMILVKVMCYEGNYIDCLMVHRDDIYHLLQAKYILYSLLLLLPFVLQTPMVFQGKVSFLMLLSYMIFTAGVVHFIFFQMAVYNKQTIPLNTKFVGKGSMETNYLQIVVELLVFFVPVIVIQVLRIFFNDTVVNTILLVLGLAFIATEPLWMRNIYQRMMSRRYVNMDALRSSR